MSIEIEHSELVKRTCKPGHEIVMSGATSHHVHMALGIAGEAGELVDAIKKHAIYNKPLDVVNVIEELGDIEWYMEGLRQGLGITREQVLEQNVKKLNKRYPQQYTDQAAVDRADKKD